MLTAVILFALLLSQAGVIDILPFEGSTLTILIIAAIALIALAVFRFLIPVIMVGIILVILVILLFGGVPIPDI